MSPLYEVIWAEVAIDQLTAMCVEHGDQLSAISATAYELERLLSRSPWQQGESRQAMHIRHFYVPPVAVEYEIIEDDKQVLIYACWYH